MIEIKPFTETDLEFKELARLSNLINHDSINHPDDDKNSWEIRDKSLIKNRLPQYDKIKNRWSEGKSVTHKEIMDIMGPGIYISLTCSPFINQNKTATIRFFEDFT